MVGPGHHSGPPAPGNLYFLPPPLIVWNNLLFFYSFRVVGVGVCCGKDPFNRVHLNCIKRHNTRCFTALTLREFDCCIII